MSATRDDAEHAKLHSAGSSVDDLQQIGHFEIEKKIGSGGMGTVFLVVDTRLKRRLALKVLERGFGLLGGSRGAAGEE